MSNHARCAADKRCEFFRATCSRNHTPEREWGGIGNTLPIYARTATRAFRQNCTVRFSNTDRSFQLQHHFLEPQLIPRLQQMPDARGCAGIALTSNPSKEVAALVQSVHNVLQTAEVRSGSGELRTNTTGGRCCERPRCGPSTIDCPPVLLALHIRTFWADQLDRAEAYRCPRPSHHQRATAANEVHALFQSPLALSKFFNDGRAITRSPTLRTMVDAAVAAGRRKFGRKASLSLFVASDS